MEKGAASSDEAFGNVIAGSEAEKNCYCYVCCSFLTKLNKHLCSYRHKIFLKRCKSVFEDRGAKVFCKTCNSEIEWKEIEHHVQMHEITPWCQLTKPSCEMFYRNHTVIFDDGSYFCYLCDRFLEYWDTASSHLMEDDHQNRNEIFGPAIDLEDITYTNIIANGIVPGSNMTIECKMCDKTDLNVQDIFEHIKAREHRKNASRTHSKILRMQEKKQKCSDSEINSLDTEESTSQLLKTNSLKEEYRELGDGVFAKIILHSAGKKGALLCCACCQNFRDGAKHLVQYHHKIYVERCKTVFEDRGKKVYCKRCSSEFEWKNIVSHAKMHKIPPWFETKKPDSLTLFGNHLCKFGLGFYYCFLCETFLDYWDTAISHIMEADHQKYKVMFGPIDSVCPNYIVAVTQGIVPGKDMKNECKMCDKTDLKADNIKEHYKAAEHKKNRDEFIAKIIRKHIEKENCANSESNSLDTQESTSKLLSADFPQKDDKLKNIKVPYSCNMICNFSLQENPDEAIPESKESTKESGNVCKTKTEISVTDITTEHEKRQNYTDFESNSSKIEESTSEPYLKVELLKEDDNPKNIEVPEDRNMIFNFILQENSEASSEENNSPKESGSIIKISYPSAEELAELSANKITGSPADENLFCCVCNTRIVRFQRHIVNYKHKICLKRCRWVFGDRGNKVFCKICSSEIEWKEIVHHGKMHEIPPWCASKKPSGETFYRNHTVIFAKEYCYCFLCEKFFDYWDIASLHFMEADHQNRKEKFGPTADLKDNKPTYLSTISNGIIPGRNMTHECKMCDQRDLKTVEIGSHKNTKQHRRKRKEIPANFLIKHEGKQNLADSEFDHYMIYYFSPQEIPKATPEINKNPKESENVNQTFRPSNNGAFPNAIVGSRGTKDFFCCICSETFAKHDNHLSTYKHKIYLDRCKSLFEDRGEKVYCKTCSSEIEWKAIKDHGEKHNIPLWTGTKKHSIKSLFHNHTAKFNPGYYYCFLCEKFLDFSDTTASHFMEADHQNRKKEFGPIDHDKSYTYAITKGIVPGKDKKFDCKMCHRKGLRASGIEEHSQTENHKKNFEKFATYIKKYEEGQNCTNSESNCLDTVASTSEPLESDSSKEDDNPKQIHVPYSRNMICNFTLQEIPDKEIPEEKESPKHNQTTEKTEYPQIPFEEKSSESTKVVSEPINQNDDCSINYIVSSTSDLCKASIVGTDKQRKRKIAMQNKAESDFYCLICYSEIPGHTAVKDHLNGKRHDTARRKYGCDNILLIEGEHYWCTGCDGPISGFDNVYRHITSNTHLIAIARMQGNNYESPNNMNQEENPMETEKSLPCMWIVKQNAKKSFCQICDENQHPVATKNINDHIASLRHTIALKRYGCDNIVLKGNDNYYCKCCHCDISNIEDVYLHIKEKKHMSSLIKVCNNEGQRGKRRIETQQLPEDFDKPFQNLLSGYITKQINKSVSYEPYGSLQHSMMSNFVVEPNNAHCSTFSDRFEPTGPKCLGNSAARENAGGFGFGVAGNGIAAGYSVGDNAIGQNHPLFSTDTKIEGVTDKQPELNLMMSWMNSEVSRFISKCDFQEMKRKAEEPQGRGEKMSALEYEAQAEKFYCNVCGEMAENTTELHVHMASHYAEEFVRFKPKMGKRADQKNHQAQQNPETLLAQPEVVQDDKIANGIVANGFSNFVAEASNQETAKICSQDDKKQLLSKSGVTLVDSNKTPQKIKHSGKIANMRKVAQILDFDADHIYDLVDKLEEVELGMMLGLVVDSSKMYCLICRNEVEYTLDNYNEHLDNIEHCQYLDEMEADDALFQDLKDQFSDLTLAKEYMQEISEDTVSCVICNENVKNTARSLQAHIYHEIHERKCEETRAIARKYFEGIKHRMYCDWYEVRKYWCVVCEADMESEVNFIRHFNRKRHINLMKRPENQGKRLLFDFCASCAVLWYGYRCTHSYHNDIDSHKWLQRDGHYVLTELPIHAKSLLASPENFIDDKIKFLDAVCENELEREKMLIRDLEKAARMKFPRSKAYVFGSRISGLGSPDSDIDVFLDCRNLYNGGGTTNDELLFFINGVHQSLCKEPQLWDVDELLTDCRIPIIKATHRATELSCDISFENGLSVENTKLIKTFNQVFPSCRKITLFLKQWLMHCGLSGSRGITSYALYWFVIFYLQKELILPSVQSLIAMRRRSQIIAGWEVGVTHNFTYNTETSTFTVKELLIRFFTFYAEFDFRYDIACPLLGEVVKKRDFIKPRDLPREMERYIAHMRGPGRPEPFRIDSPMCIQDPFDLQHNLTKAVNKVYLNRFRKCCAKSLEILWSS